MNNTALSEKEYLTVADVQNWLNISQGAAYALVHRKDFPVCRFGGTIRIPKLPFLAWVEDHTNNPMRYGIDVA